MPDIPPFLADDPSSAYPAYFDAQRQQMISQLLLQNMQRSGQTPDNWNSMRLVPRRSPLSAVTQLMSGVLAGKGLQNAQQAEMNYWGKLYGVQPSQPQAVTQQQPTPLPAAPPADPNEVGPQPLVARNGQTLGQVAQASMPPSQSAPQQESLTMQRLKLFNPQEYLKLKATQEMGSPEWQTVLKAAGGNQDIAQQLLIGKYEKEGSNLIPTRPGQAVYNARTGRVEFSAPSEEGVQTSYGPNGPTQSVVPGALQAHGDIKATTKAAEVSQTPIPGLVDDQGRPITNAYYRPPAYAQGGPHAGGQPSGQGQGYFPSGGGLQTTAGKAEQEAGGKEGVEYAASLRDNADNALKVRRDIMELTNLAKDAPPSAFNEAKIKMGAYMQAAGMDRQSVMNYMGLDTGAGQAMDKLTTKLATGSTKEITSRPSTFEFQTAVKNNPNGGQTPEGFRRTAEYLLKNTEEPVARNQDFVRWRKDTGAPANTWAIDHPAAWQAKQLDLINRGHYNTAPVPSPAPIRAGQDAGLDAAMRRNLRRPNGG